MYLVLCKQSRLNWFRYTSVLSVPGKRSFGDTELAYFLLNMESLREIDLNQCQNVEHFPQPQKNNIHPNLISVNRHDVRVITSFASILFWEIGGAF